ncbi:MAG TPA: hypothetical protein VKO20_07505, partial [Desulfosalsimonadaceae bacterium]|nr:hypothetical protein [Desulfosalsimonadaceae bacterium]
NIQGNLKSLLVSNCNSLKAATPSAKKYPKAPETGLFTIPAGLYQQAYLFISVRIQMKKPLPLSRSAAASRSKDVRTFFKIKKNPVCREFGLQVRQEGIKL